MKKTMTNTEYHNDSALSSTDLKLGLESPAHIHKRHLFKFEQTPAMEVGSAFHHYLLEPNSFFDFYAISPDCDRRTKAGKEAFSKFQEESEGKTVITEQVMEKIRKMALNAKEIMGGLLEKGEKEVSFFADYNGVKIKCRPDLIIESDNGAILVDIKTTSDISEFGIFKSIRDYKYNISDSFYRLVLEKNGISVNSMIFVFVETNNAHMVKFRRISDESRRESDNIVINILDEYIDYIKNGNINIVKDIDINLK